MSISTHLALVHHQADNAFIVLNLPVANGVTVIGRRDRGAIAILAEVGLYKNTCVIETRISFLSLMPTYQPESSFITDKLLS